MGMFDMLMDEYDLFIILLLIQDYKQRNSIPEHRLYHMDSLEERCKTITDKKGYTLEDIDREMKKNMKEMKGDGRWIK